MVARTLLKRRMDVPFHDRQPSSIGTNGGNSDRTPNAGGSAPHPPTVFSNNNGNRGNNGDTPTRTPNTDAGRMNSGQPNSGQPNGNQNVARPYPRPPSGGERQPMGNNPGNTQNQPARTYTPSSFPKSGRTGAYELRRLQNQPQRSARLRQTISRSEAMRLRQTNRRIRTRSLREELRRSSLRLSRTLSHRRTRTTTSRSMSATPASVYGGKQLRIHGQQLQLSAPLTGRG